VLLGVSPHMHLRGKSFRLVSNADNENSIMLDVPQYDFNWQHVYEFKEPIPLSAVDQLDFDVVFDNSTNNPVNPNPEEFVCWGDQTWEEMAVAFFEVAEPIETSADSSNETASLLTDESAVESIAPERQQRIDQFVDDFFTRFDKNEDGTIVKSETPISFRRFSFRLYDTEKDNQLTRDEVVEAATQKLR